MKLLTSLTIVIVVTLAVLEQTRIPRSNEAQAKQELNEAAIAYRDGNFDEAQLHCERALQLDPQNTKAMFFMARTIHAQYRPGIGTLENVAIAQQAITAYQKILERIPGDDEAYKAVASLYGAMKEDELLRQWILQRALNGSDKDKRAEAFLILASKDFDCSFNITEQPNIKVATVDGNKASVTYRKPKDQVEFDRAKQCANRGMEMVTIAIALAPENESAWSYKTNLLRELEKLAEMSGEVKHKTELHRQYEEALMQTTALSKRSQSNP